MPRRIRGADEQARPVSGEFTKRLADELRSSHQSGQPIIDEEKYSTGKIRVTVIWDEWDRVALEDRTTIILRAYEMAEGREYRDEIALASGLTVPEAYAAGLLPYQIIPAVRKGDPVSPDQCRQAMIDEGASTLLAAENPQLRFARLDDAEAARKRLADRLPGSEPVWVITQEVGKVEDWVQR